MAKGTLSALLLGCIALSGCGGGGGGGEDGDRTFDGEGYSLTYPGTWDEQDPGFRSEGAETISSAYLGYSGTDVLAVLAYALPLAVTEGNIDQVADFITQETKSIYEDLDGELLNGPQSVTVGGLPGLRYEGSLVNADDVEVGARITRVFDGSTEYYLYCQYTPERAEEMKRGCDQAASSFRVG